MKINYLRPWYGIATKTFRFDKEKQVWKLESGYQIGKWFEGYSYEVKDLREFYELLKRKTKENCFMIQGTYLPKVNTRRMKRLKRKKKYFEPTLTDRKLDIICLDVDGYQFPAELSSHEAIELLIAELPITFAEADYVYQFSASWGMRGEKTVLKCHLFFELQTAVEALEIRKWVVRYNKEKGWGKVLDPAVFSAAQPIYTHRRICLGGKDPVENFLGYVKKDGKACWQPEPEEEVRKEINEGAQDTRENSVEFRLEKSLQRILSGESFHEEIRGAALSLAARGMTERNIKSFLEQLMLTAKPNLSEERLQDWEVRFADIERLVSSCFEINENPALEDIIKWVRGAPVSEVRDGYIEKVFRKGTKELNKVLKIVEMRTGDPLSTLKAEVKEFRAQNDKKRQKKILKQKREKNQKEGIFEVKVNKHNFQEAADKTAQILSNSSRQPPVFKDDSGLLELRPANAITIRKMKERYEKKAQKEPLQDNLVIRHYRKPFHDLIARCGQDIRFVSSMQREIKCPDVLAGVIGSGQSRHWRELTGIIECPFVDQNYQIFSGNGYDEQTGLFANIHFSVSENDLKPAETAYEYLLENIFDEFPFRSDLDAAVLIAALLALMERPVLAQDPAGMPGFGITAPVQASGKTTLVQLLTNIVYQRSIPASSFANDENELAKHLLAILLEGSTCVLFDNVKEGSEIKSDILAKAMSSDIFSSRLLGMNRTAPVQASVVWFFTGNNINFGGDFATRIYPIFLHPKMENPDQRVFRRLNILEWGKKRRETIIIALLSILKNAERKKTDLTTASRFHLWDRMIRDSVYLASGIDVNRAILTNKENDQDFIFKKMLVRSIYDVFETKLITSRDIITNAFNEDVYCQAGNKSIRLKEALEDILGKKYCDNPKSLGRLLAKMLGRVYSGLMLKKEEKDRAYWYIEKVENEQQ